MTGLPAPARAALAAYAAGMEVAVWGGLVPFGRVTREDLRARLGRSVPAAGGAPLLVHAVSVGETVAAEALLEKLLPLVPGTSVVLTAGNRDGLAAARRVAARLPAPSVAALLPWDRPGAMFRWLERLAPRGVVVLETEIWPGLFRACERLGLPLVLAGARIFPSDRPRYRAARFFFGPLLSIPRLVATPDEDERAAFLSIGAPPERVETTGDLKAGLSGCEPEPTAWDESLRDSAPLLVAGSTHAGEEEPILDAFTELRGSRPGLRLLLAPRHVARASRVASRAASRFRVARFSGGPVSGWEVLVVDEIGPLAGLYRFASAAFVGGSLGPQGGHNPCEPARAGVPVVMGPFVDHVLPAVRALEAGGRLRRTDRAGLAAALREALDRPRDQAGSRRALASLAAGAEATARRIADVLRQPSVVSRRGR